MSRPKFRVVVPGRSPAPPTTRRAAVALAEWLSNALSGEDGPARTCVEQVSPSGETASTGICFVSGARQRAPRAPRTAPVDPAPQGSES